MEKFRLALLVFCATICIANSLKCYQCSGEGDEEYTKEQCEKDQTEVWCNSTQELTQVCFRMWGEKTDDKEVESRGCVPKSTCDGEIKKYCTDEEKMKELKIKECDALCCDTELCNSAFTTSASIVMMFAALCSVMLF